MSEVEAEATEQAEDVLPVGSKFGRYTIVRLIGMGGMGAVYEATHADLKKRVALKTLHPSYAQHVEIRQRFLREGELASRIHHPNVVDVTDFGTEHDISFLVMEFLEGMSLEERIEKDGRLESSIAADVMLGCCAGVGAAHDEGVIHRDLKPANIFLLRQRGGDYRVKIVDFGISKATERSLEGSLTSTGHVVGTPFYMAPEQMRSSREVDARADQYSLGVTLYEALCGKKPFEADSLFEVVRKVAQGDYAQPRDLVPEIPEGLETIVLKMMAVDPAHRFADLREVGLALLPFATDRAKVLFSTEFGDGVPVDVVAPPRPDMTGAVRAVRGEAATVAATPGTKQPAQTVTGQTFELSRPPEAPAAQRSKITPIAGVFVATAIGIAFWAGSQREPARASTDTPRSVAATSNTQPVGAVAQPEYSVAITATPSDAWIVVDNQFTVPGEFSRPFARDGRTHRVTVRAAGYVSQTFEFTGPIVRAVSLDRDPAAVAAPILPSALADSGAAGAAGAVLAGRPNGRPNGRNNGSSATSTGAQTTGAARTTTGAQGSATGSNANAQSGTNGALIIN
jgi:serine/threonine-protein kinase